jgi:hypothetical protein
MRATNGSTTRTAGSGTSEGIRVSVARLKKKTEQGETRGMSGCVKETSVGDAGRRAMKMSETEICVFLNADVYEEK